jgi:hypothetical protein
LEILTVPAAELSDSSRNALSRSSISICYASVFDERWVVDVPTLVSRASWRTEERCRPNPANSRL